MNQEIKKTRGKYIIKNAAIVTVNDKNEIIKNGSIVIEGNKIKDIGKTADILKKYGQETEIDASGMVAMPGFINGHIHTITSLYKGTMQGFGFERNAGEDTNLAFRATPEIMFAASKLAALEMMSSGITLANVATDAMTFEVSRQAAEALGQAGMKAFVQTAIADIFGPADMDIKSQFQEEEKLRGEYHNKFDGRIRVSLGPVGEISTSIKTMKRLAKIAEEKDLVVHVHIFPGWPTGSFSFLFRGRSPIGLLKAGGLLNKRLIAVHFLAAGNSDIKAIAKSGASVIHCPSVWMNAAIGPNHWTPIKKLHQLGVNISLGTDSLGGWIEGSDMFTEMRNCLLMSNFLYGAGSLEPANVLKMATINGARALGLEKETGSLEIGKKADIILLKFNHPATRLSNDIPAMIVYGASGRDVQTVFIDGRMIIQDKRNIILNGEEILAEAVGAREKLYRLGGWKFEAGELIPPETSWLERYPNKSIAKWGARIARIQKLFKK